MPFLTTASSKRRHVAYLYKKRVSIHPRLCTDDAGRMVSNDSKSNGYCSDALTHGRVRNSVIGSKPSSYPRNRPSFPPPHPPLLAIQLKKNLNRLSILFHSGSVVCPVCLNAILSTFSLFSLYSTVIFPCLLHGVYICFLVRFNLIFDAILALTTSSVVSISMSDLSVAGSQEKAISFQE